MIDSESSGRFPSGRAILVGRACGLAAGTLLACGSVLASAANVGDGSLAGQRAPLRTFTPTAPSDAGTPEAQRENVPTSAVPDLVRAQVVANMSPAPRMASGRVRRNIPASVGLLSAPAEPSANARVARQPEGSAPPSTGYGPIAPVRPVLDPAARGIGRLTPVGGVLAPTKPRPQRAGSSRQQRVSLYPAMAMLTSVLPAG
ncbi:MAG: hypothetical protein ACRDRS_18965 [Pseudonocardiaceae bacterium]